MVMSSGGGETGQVRGYKDRTSVDPRYKDIDTHALNAPSSVEGDINTLAQYLIKPARNHLEKARAVYRWITENISYNIDGLLKGDYGDPSAQGVLKSRSSICEGYANLFSNLAQKAGLEVVKISGYAKGYGYVVGGSIGGDTNHAWNAVKIDGQWLLIDSTWGAGYADQQNRFVRRFSEHYFLTPPEQFIYDHFPSESKWQLLNKPISRQEYEQRVHILPIFFYCGLSIESHPQGVIRTDRDAVITLRALYDTALVGQLQKDGSQVQGSDIKISDKGNGYLEIYTELPGPGEYFLMLFTKEGLGLAGEYEWALTYKIVVGN